MEKIIVVGCPGAGKTTFARALGTKLRIPVHHLDAHFWKENWSHVPDDEFLVVQTHLMHEPRWILEGHYRKSIPHRIASADTIIVFDFPKLLCFWRVLKRYFKHRGTTRSDIGGNYEALQWQLVRYMLKFDRRALIDNVQRLSQGKRLVIFRKPKDVVDFLASV